MQTTLPTFQGGNYRLWLCEVLGERRKRNASYSLRAFSSALGLSHATLSQVISGKRPLTQKMISRIADNLGLSPDLKTELSRSAHLARFDGEIQDSVGGSFHQLETETFRMISEWYHYAILCLSHVPGCCHSPHWIAKRLGISVSTAKAAFQRLEKLNLVEKTGTGYRELVQQLTTSEGVTSSALRNFQRQNLRKAEEALDTIPTPLRDLTSMTMAIDMAKLPLAVKEIQRFRRSLAKLLESGKQERVYTLAVQLFPIDIGEKRSRSAQ